MISISLRTSLCLSHPLHLQCYLRNLCYLWISGRKVKMWLQIPSRRHKLPFAIVHLYSLASSSAQYKCCAMSSCEWKWVETVEIAQGFQWSSLHQLGGVWVGGPQVDQKHHSSWYSTWLQEVVRQRGGQSWCLDAVGIIAVNWKYNNNVP
jgi:hypothetical protein